MARHKAHERSTKSSCNLPANMDVPLQASRSGATDGDAKSKKKRHRKRGAGQPKSPPRTNNKRVDPRHLHDANQQQTTTSKQPGQTKGVISKKRKQHKFRKPKPQEGTTTIVTAGAKPPPRTLLLNKHKKPVPSDPALKQSKSRDEATKSSKVDKPKKEQPVWKIEICKMKISNSRIIAWEGPVKVLLTMPEMTSAVKEILASGEKHLGFDTETRPNYKRGGFNPTALIQLATAKTVYLFRICKLPGHNFDPLLPILTNPSILKTGVSICEDVKDLCRIQHFQPAGFVDTTEITQKVLGIKNGGLRALAVHFLDGRITKGAQMSNWACNHLDPQQIRYAATDAWVSREIHVRAAREAESTEQLASSS